MTTLTALTEIARRDLRLETLEIRGYDRLDFHDLSVWRIRVALEAAYQAGRDSAQEEAVWAKVAEAKKGESVADEETADYPEALAEIRGTAAEKGDEE